MSKTKPLFGSKISLISKAEIRYEGTLYEVDADNSTVTLAKVRSFGTEGRPAPKQIQPRNEVYEYIIFRGNDIKDLNVSDIPGQQSESPDHPQDPAIVSAHTMPPPALLTPGSMVSQSTGPLPPHLPPLPTMPPAPGGPMPPPQTSHPYYARPPAPGGYSAFGMQYFRPPMMMGTAGGARHPQPPSMPAQNVSPQPPSSRASPQTSMANSSMPGHLVAVVPPHGSQVAVESSPDQILSSSGLGPMLTASPLIVPPASADNKPQASSTPLVAVSESDASLIPTASSIPISTTEPVLPVDNEPPILPSRHSQQRAVDSTESRHPSTAQPTHKTTTITTAATKSGRETVGAWKKSGGGGGGAGNGRQETDGAGGVKKQQPVPSWRARDQGQRESRRGGGGNYGNSGYVNSGRGGSRNRRDNYRSGRGTSAGGYRRGEGHQERQPDRSTFKYDSEFDFESANARFKKEDLEHEFKHKLRMDDHNRRSSEGSSRKASVGSGHDLNESSDEEAEIIEDGASVSDEVEDYYDKSKSFFDNISCETNNTASARRPTRNEEREVNTETFGVSSVNNNYGYYRYRRNWRGRGRGGGRGGGRGRYRNDDGGQYSRGRGGGRGQGRGGGRGNGGRGGGYRNNYDSYQANPL